MLLNLREILEPAVKDNFAVEIGRASCRERV